MGIRFLFARAVYWFSSNKRIAVFTGKIWCDNPIKVAQAIVTNKHLLYIRIDIPSRILSWKRGFGKKKVRARNIRFRLARLISDNFFPFRRKKYVRPYSLSFYLLHFVRHLLPNVTRSAILDIVIHTYVREYPTRREIFSLNGREKERKAKLLLFQRIFIIKIFFFPSNSVFAWFH